MSLPDPLPTAKTLRLVAASATGATLGLLAACSPSEAPESAEASRMAAPPPAAVAPELPATPEPPSDSNPPLSADMAALLDESTVDTTAPAPGLEDRAYVAPLADAYARIDPTNDGWDTEAFHESANYQLGQLAEHLSHPETPHDLTLAPDFASSPWVASEPVSVREAERGFAVERLNVSQAPLPASLDGPEGLQAAAEEMTALFAAAPKIKFKHYRIEPAEDGVRSRARVEVKGTRAAHAGQAQITAEWDLAWTGLTDPVLRSIRLAAWEHVTYRGATKTLFEDRTPEVLARNASFQEQLLRSTDHWRSRIPRNLGVDVVANHGLALGDVNGDRLDDLYLCMQGGLPNRLFLRQPDGSLVDFSRESGTDWLDYCASALFIDFDNDGDKDLVVGQEWRVLFMENDGNARFELAFGLGTPSQTFSLAAADYDVDGDVDVYVCGYNPPVGDVRSGAMGEPMPYHDAQNGGANILLRNDGNWEFNEATAEAGLSQNNNRFSFAAAWEDYDNDGDLDLYVANDYGRNNLYQNKGGRFQDVANDLGLEDMSSGMSVAWGDANRDGWMDLYVSNMFSAAGNRITYQRQFKTSEEADTKAIFQRHARGNSLFQATGEGQFEDVSEAAGVTMGRWAWGSVFADLNNDGWQDLAVANGFITTEDTGDL